MTHKLPEIGIENIGNKTKLFVENIKCGGCGNTITKSLQSLGLIDINVDPDNNTVDFLTPDSNEKILEALDKLTGLGYPLVNSEEGLKALLSTAKSYASCAIGKISK